MEVLDHKLSQTPLPAENKEVRESTILCCLCGAPFAANVSRTSICLKCISTQTDITEGITKQAILNYCKKCQKYLRPPWVYCELESKELLSLCLKKIKGLNKVQLNDATFVWTEPHSKRIKVKLTVQKDIMSGPTVVQTFVVEFTIHDQQCEDCQKSFTPHKWEASVQVRQKVDHKKTFHFLEQLILKHNAQEHVINVKEVPEGLDFFFKSKPHAQRFVEFLQSNFPVRVENSKQLIGQDLHNNTYNYKYVFCVEIPKACREDLVLLGPKIINLLGGCSPVLICQKVSSMIHFLDPYTMQVIEMSGHNYFQNESEMTFYALKNHATEYTVFDIEKVDPKKINSSFQTVPKKQVVSVSVGRNSDWKMYDVKTHLGDIIKEGDSLLGYDLSTMTFTGLGDSNPRLINLPEAILVKKIYPERKKTKRAWKVKQLRKEAEEKKKKDKKAKKEGEDSFEEFLDELEENPEMRANVNLYKNENELKELQEKKADVNEGAKPLSKKKSKIAEDPQAIDETKPEEQKAQASQLLLEGGDINSPEKIKMNELSNEVVTNEPEIAEGEVIDDEAVNEFLKKKEKLEVEK